MSKLHIFFLYICLGCAHGMEKGSYLGCYKYDGTPDQDVITNISSIQDCIKNCETKQLQFAALSNSNTTCFCTTFLGELGNSNSSQRCQEYSVYFSRDTIPDPPKNFKIESLTDESVQLSWNKPDNFVDVVSYEITSKVLHTFSQYPLNNLTWVYSKNTFQTALTLQPASKYNLTIYGKSSEGIGKPASLIVETPVGIPDNIPQAPEILSRNGSKMIIKIHPVINNNGPISFYQVIVLNEVAGQYFQPEYLKNYEEALESDLNYYIAAELTPYGIKENFIIGDENYYGKYKNAALLSSINYNVMIAIVSTYNGETRTVYGNISMTNSKRHAIDTTELEDGAPITATLLIIGIIILSLLLVAGIIVFLVLRKRVTHSHRHNRLSEQELTLQGPMISVENSCYLPEEEQSSVNHYTNLKQRVRILSLKNELSVDAHSIIGKGKFGTVCNAVLNENNDYIPLAAYTIADKTLLPDQKRMMLKDLDILIRCKHDNIVELVGTSESSHTLYVLLKMLPMNLKQFLISNRVLLPNRFCKIYESQVLGIITQITHGLSELERNRINHTQLCARNILLSEDLTPKIFGFGLADYVTEREPDYTRWTAMEVLKGNDFNCRSPIWSFGVLLWEICALGATPYSDISNISELIDKISRGTRLPQLKYFNDDLYHIMLSCWQVDMGERPDCETLCRVIENLQEDMLIPFISFNLYQSFEYEQYKSELEFKS